MTIDPKDIGRRIRGLREKLSPNMTQGEFGCAALGYSIEKIGAAQSKIKRMEAGKSLDLVDLCKIANFLNENLPVFFQDTKKIECDYDNVIDIQHANIIKNFIDKERAININKALVELEKIDEDALTGTEGFILGQLESAKRNKKRSNNKTDKCSGRDSRQSG